MMSVLTTGGRESAYQPDGHNRFTVEQFLAPIEQTARLCGVDYLPPFVVHGTHAMKTAEIAAHANDYRQLIEAFRDDTVDVEAARGLPRINADLGRIIRPSGDE